MRVQPIFEEKCVLCHNSGKFKGKLRLDSYEHVMRGGKDGLVVAPGQPGKKRTLSSCNPPAGKQGLHAGRRKASVDRGRNENHRSWIAAGATIRIADSAIQGLPSTEEKPPAPPLTPDYRPQVKTIAALETSLGVSLDPSFAESDRRADPSHG